MHELSLARDIVEMVYLNVPSNEINQVRYIVVKVGEFSGVVKDSLKFSFQAITSETDLEKAQLDVIDVPFKLKCNLCGRTTSNEFGMMICENCGSTDTIILSGIELQVVEVKLNTNHQEVT